MDQGIISLPRCSLVSAWKDDGQEKTALISHFPFFLSLQIWSMDSDEPVHSLEADSRCWCLAWRPNGKKDDVDGGISAARKSKNNLTIAW